MINQLVYYLKRPYHLVKTGLLSGLPAQIKHGFPGRKLKVIAFTGTDGKTTSSTLMYYVLKAAGKKVALLSTVAAYVGEKEYDTGFHVTSPSPADLQKFMRMMVDEGYEYLVLEVTSHGVYQFRTWGIKPILAGVTNIAREHLDYHLTYENYVAAKALLLKQAKTVILNVDDQSCSKLRKILKNQRKQLLEYGVKSKLPRVIKQAFTARFPQLYNQQNARLVSTAALHLGIAPKAIAAGIQQFPGVPGRMQFIPNAAGFEVVVDFAHTPQALEAALTTLRARLAATSKKGRLIAVFGCAGLRDRSKRPAMGKIASEIADIAIFTAEDPRTEDIWAIIRQMKSGVVVNHNRVVSIPNRQEAVTYALTQCAKKGDIVGIFGKGHEQSMCYGTTEYPWSDVTAATQLLTTMTNK